MHTLSIVIPALNEAPNLSTVMASVPVAELAAAGWQTEILVVDNASTDDTAEVARALGARVVSQPERGYGNAYLAGFEAAKGDVIATGDADCTYPFDALPQLLGTLVERDIEFLTTDRLRRDNRAAMKRSHTLANHALSALSRCSSATGCATRSPECGSSGGTSGTGLTCVPPAWPSPRRSRTPPPRPATASWRCRSNTASAAAR